MLQSIRPWASAPACTACKILSHVPSADHRRCLSCTVFHFPNRSGRSLQGMPVRSRNKIPLITTRWLFQRLPRPVLFGRCGSSSTHSASEISPRPTPNRTTRTTVCHTIHRTRPSATSSLALASAVGIAAKSASGQRLPPRPATRALPTGHAAAVAAFATAVTLSPGLGAALIPLATAASVFRAAFPIRGAWFLMPVMHAWSDVMRLSPIRPDGTLGRQRGQRVCRPLTYDDVPAVGARSDRRFQMHAPASRASPVPAWLAHTGTRAAHPYARKLLFNPVTAPMTGGVRMWARSGERPLGRRSV